MVIQNVDGIEYYNYAMKDMKIIDHPSDVMQTSATMPVTTKDYATHMRDLKRYGKCKRFRRFLYNKDNKTSCNRTGKHWGSLIFYYAFFLGILLILFLCYFYGVNRLIVHTDRMMPPLEKFYTNIYPTFTYVPIKVNMLAHPIIWYKFKGADNERNRRLDPYVTAIRDYYKGQATICAKKKIPTCTVDPDNYGPCGVGHFGYDEQKPCILLKLNTTVCMYCSGSSLYDKEHIGEIVYHPEPCFNDSFFPFGDDPVNINPTIAIQLNTTDPGYILSLTCRLFGVEADGTGEYEQSVFIYIGRK